MDISRIPGRIPKGDPYQKRDDSEEKREEEKNEGVIIGIGHKAQRGKTEVASFLVRTYGFRRLAFADTLKEVAQLAFSLTDGQVYGKEKLEEDEFWQEKIGESLDLKYGAKSITPVLLLQLVGTEAFRNTISEDIWIWALARKIAMDPSRNYVIDDVRFRNEAQWVRDQRGGILIKVNRNVGEGVSGRNNGHPSEIDLDSWKDWNYQIENNGSILDLQERMSIILQDQQIIPWEKDGHKDKDIFYTQVVSAETTSS